MTSTFSANGKRSELTPAQALTKSNFVMIDSEIPTRLNPAFWAPSRSWARCGRAVKFDKVAGA